MKEYHLFYRRAGFAVSRTDQIADLLKRHELEVKALANLSSLMVCDKITHTFEIYFRHQDTCYALMLKFLITRNISNVWDERFSGSHRQ